jgi:hypothetical protein
MINKIVKKSIFFIIGLVSITYISFSIGEYSEYEKMVFRYQSFNNQNGYIGCVNQHSTISNMIFDKNSSSMVIYSSNNCGIEDRMTRSAVVVPYEIKIKDGNAMLAYYGKLD